MSVFDRLFGPGGQSATSEWYGWRGAMQEQVHQMAETVARLERKFDKRMDDQDEAIAKVLDQATKTNGRVTQIENERSAATQRFRFWATIVATSVGGGGIVTLIVSLLK